MDGNFHDGSRKAVEANSWACLSYMIQLSPQFHVVYDEWYSTLPLDPNDQQLAAPEVWQDLLTISRDEITFEDADVPPQLHPDWLTNEEADRRAIYERRKQRERNLLPAEEPADVVIPNEDDDMPQPDNIIDDQLISTTPSWKCNPT